jgi:homogentisate 1,2-dioxygenase
MATHPLDVVGWDGYYFPWAFNIGDFEPITGRIHQPPPVHQTFEGDGFVICSFVPRLYDYHPDAVPAPYNHSNVDSDEVMFFSNTSYGARKGVIEAGSMTFHPSSLPHSPQGDAAARSVAARGKLSDYLAVMLDTFFEPLHITKAGLACADKDYALSWHKKP